MEFNLEEFVKAPTLEVFHKCTKDVLLLLAEQYQIAVTKQAKKAVIKAELLSAFVQSGIFPAAALPKSPRSPSSAAPDDAVRLKELEVEMARLALREKELYLEQKKLETQKRFDYESWSLKFVHASPNLQSSMKKGHIAAKCPVLKGLNENPVALVNTQGNQIVLPVGPGCHLEKFSPFVMNGLVSLCGDDVKIPVKILRDTAASQSFILSDVLAFGEMSSVGAVVPVLGFAMEHVDVPIHRICIESDLVSGEVEVGVRPEFPIRGIHLIMGNDLAGGGVVASPGVTVYPLHRGPGEQNVKLPVELLRMSGAAPKHKRVERHAELSGAEVEGCVPGCVMVAPAIVKNVSSCLHADEGGGGKLSSAFDPSFNALGISSGAVIAQCSARDPSPDVVARLGQEDYRSWRILPNVHVIGWWGNRSARGNREKHANSTQKGPAVRESNPRLLAVRQER
ncbi:hypothetical protein WMY93_000976 [Mugilogobius chulae]|uniref:Uncharacterized protein n=1 Tax=Mugilogobius chulae TaxID=88201 RepID=A0AAW0Q1X5_9GOBI